MYLLKKIIPAFLAIIFIGSCNLNRPKKYIATGCEHSYNFFAIPFVYSGKISGKITFYRKNGEFSVIEAERRFCFLYNTISKEEIINNRTYFSIDSISFCQDFIIELEVDNEISIHKFSNIELIKNTYGDSEVFSVSKYRYNDNIYIGGQCDFDLEVQQFPKHVKLSNSKD